MRTVQSHPAGCGSRALRIGTTALLFLVASFAAASAAPLTGSPATYTTTGDFDEGGTINVVTTGDEVAMDDTTRPFEFIWVAVSSKNTIVKIDTKTGAVLGEYRSAPQSSGKGDPSRTTVDKNGSVWVGNRAGGSVVHIGLEENGRCVDRNGNNVIDTSTGLGDIRAWPGSTADEAADECIIHYTNTANADVRHVTVNADNDVWISGITNRIFQRIDGATGAIVETAGSVGYGGYGGLIDGNGVIWSARNLMRWDPANPLSGPSGGNWTGYSHDSYGLCIDPDGNVWNTALNNNQIRKFAPDGTLIGTYGHGSYYAQGCVADDNGDIWVAGSLYDSVVGHLLNDGTLVGVVNVGSGPTGVAVDATGKIWATNYNVGTVSRIDPTAGPIGGGGVPAGAVDLTTVALGGNTYNYSDMTGSTLIGAPENGSWSIVHDTEIAMAPWGTVSWNASTPGDSSLTVSVQTSEDGMNFSSPVAATSGAMLTVSDGRWIRVQVSFARASTGESPALHDLTIAVYVADPYCGDGQTTEGEECDDGNTATGDGCDDVCAVEECWVCEGSSCLPDDGAACDDGNVCTVGDVCGDGACIPGDPVVFGAACLWFIVGESDTGRDVDLKEGSGTDVLGDICLDEAKVGMHSMIVGNLAVTAASGSKGIRFAPGAMVSGDIVTGGAGIKGTHGAALPHLTPPTGALAGGLVLYKDDPPGGMYDTGGASMVLADCMDAMAAVDSAQPVLDALMSDQSNGRVRVAAGDTLTIAPSVPGGINVIDYDRLLSGLGATVELSGGGDPDTVMIVRVAGKVSLRGQSAITLTDGLLPSNVILYGAGKKVQIGSFSTVEGTIFSSGKVKLGNAVHVLGQIFGRRRKIKLGNELVGTVAPNLVVLP